METTPVITSTTSPSKSALWTGRVLTTLVVLFLLFDAITKVIKEAHTISASAKLGWTAQGVQNIGFVLLACTIIYIIPRTAILGAILLTGYLGGATAVSVMTGYPFFFPVIFGILAWLGLWLRDAGLRKIVPLRTA